MLQALRMGIVVLHVESGRELSEADVENCLRLLAAVPTRNGLTKLVDRQDAGQWLLRGV